MSTADSLIVVIDEAGRVVVEGRAATRKLAARPGRYRLVPSSNDLVVLERVSGDRPVDLEATGHTVLAGDVGRVGGLIDVVHFIYGSGWSGQLTVLDNTVRKTIYFRRGDVRMAASNVPEDRLGAILYRFGRISAEELDRALAQVTQEHRVGQILVDSGALTAHDLYQFVRKQVEEIFYSVLVLREGEYYFYRTGDEDGPPSQLQLSTKQLLFEGVKRIDELSYFREKIAGGHVVPAQRTPPPEGRLPAREARFLALVDGARDLAAIARDSHLGEFEATKVAFQLLHTDWIQLVDRAPASATAPEASAASSPEALALIVAGFNDAYAAVNHAVQIRGGQDAMLKGLDSFFQSAAEFAPLFVGVAVSDEGRLQPEQLLANLDLAPAGNKADYLRRGMRELLHFQLFSAGESVDRDQEAELNERLDEILRALPGRTAP